ncbi:UgpQ Glycerophosphoryl diester phosphodiesterase [Pyrenophora tritici-repentis]|uniref:Glycerophosphodiester phosphodiesterase GDE1 n=2 Tax=Pyrenophora tritici-repentis TaxID=45151 RepID=A0A2W1FMK3_9PLEO|nr:glycerophosphodiester phosphodiesterase GDE1 [Pyrenophora tritici-repentis Pt-1C-BFP]KAA8624434.1 Glycerophosphodiester phosphodiesterase GDE1 [Pyrenophora tritici-repentis]EDU44462.1 glycerophosphodiester phosphodiesterase GDE1 [Pyrenophora tritici-repentis Pt-1C-BFP]KAF7452839.1 Glycerophosphodiester phosphodiesterase GDE1 [Pyrenophora tritici-repentis]KAF7575865.1 SPX domain-containing protein involved in vacuolar polyphosphate accumulation [Pyrenophora tritici-repentis]KAG9377715.1 hypo
MKFGHNLPRNQVPEWASSYINYKGLKKLVKNAAEAYKNGAELDLAEFFFSLDRNLEDVDSFYNRKYAECARRLRLLHGRYGRVAQMPDGIDKDEAQDLMGALLELRSSMRKLQWYGEVNRRGFIKITKKLDKKIETVCLQERYLASKVNPKPFAHNLPLNQDMKAVNEWLSGLGDIKTFDDTGSTHSAGSLGRVPGRSLHLPSTLLDAVDLAIRGDKAEDLRQQLTEAAANNGKSSSSFQQLLLNFLQRAVSCRAKSCIEMLLKDIISLDEEDDINKRNCVHRLVINIGRSKSGETLGADGAVLQTSNEPRNFILPATDPNRQPRPCTTTEEESTQLLSENDESVRLLIYLLDQLRGEQRNALQSRDSYGRLPLHYAAQYGFVIICEVVMKHMQDWGQFDVSQGIDSDYWQDAEGNAPLHLSVMGGHPLTTKALLTAESWRGTNEEKLVCRKTIARSGAALALATRSNFVDIVRLLVEAGVDVNYQDEGGEAALHMAARYGYDECAKVLLEGSSINKADVNVAEKTFAWTPLFIACVDDHLSMVEILAAAGADLQKCDNSGWTAKEHAALRGHMEIAARLAELAPIDESPRVAPTDTRIARAGSPTQSSLDERRSKNLNRDNNTPVQKAPEPVKTFGHRYLTNQTMVLVSLGSMDIRKDVPAVKLDDIPLADAHATQLDTALSVVVGAAGASGDSTVIDLPIRENIATEPITFMTSDVSKVKLLFDIVPTYAGSQERVVGRAVALLSTIKTSIGSKRISLQGDVQVPIVAASTLDVIGAVNFNFLIITPFHHPRMAITEQHTYWKKMASTMVIGHRGLGKNTASRTSLQLGENTIQSFISAANLGAEYVEFDVQLTKDHVPVIYHDFLVSETGIDAPVHTLTLDQFLHIGEGQKPRPNRVEPSETVPVSNGTNGTDDRPSARRPRSYSVDNSKQRNIHTDREQELTERMKHTRDFKKKGFKGNSRGNSIQSSFTTLERMFDELPESVGFNVEMKYPMLHESEEEEMDQYAVELNSFVDTVLQKVYDKMGERNVIFSSFNPDICLMLSFKQPSIPVLFLTDAGTSPVGDVRAASLQEAIRFASRWNLLGVVSAATPLVMCPRLVKVVKESGLVCVSYGILNNDPKNVLLQRSEGIDAVIVDSVLKVRQGLQAPNHDATTNGAVNGAAIVVPEDTASIAKEVNGLMQKDNSSVEAQQQQQAV